MANIPDFRPQRQIDPMAIVNALAEKRRAEAQLQEQKNFEEQRKYQNIKDVVGSITNLTQGIITASRENLKASARRSLAEMLTTKEDLVPTGEGGTAKVSGMEVPVAQMGTVGEQPGFLPKAQGLAIKAGIKGSEEGLAEQLFPKPSSTQEKDFAPQQASLELKNGEIAAATFKNGKYYYANTDEVIPPKEMAGKGYGLVPVTNADGSKSFVSRTTARKLGNIDTSAAPIPKSKLGKVTDLNDPLIQGADRKEIITQLNKVKADPIVKGAVKMIPMLDNVERYLKEDNKVALDRLGGLTQKMIALDSGNLAAWEQRDPGSRDYISRLKQFASMASEGKLAPKNKEELIKVLTITRDNLKTNVETSAGASIDSLVEIYPQLNKEAMYKKTGMGGIIKYITTNQKKKEVPNVEVPQGWGVEYED